MLGGYGVFGKGATAEKTFTNLKPHNKLKITFTYFAIDTWDKEYMRLNVDGKLRSNS